MMKYLIVGLLLLATGCATSAQLQREQLERQALERDLLGKILLVQDRTDGAIYAIDSLEKEFKSGWSRPECAHYALEAQRMFCKRVTKNRFEDAGEKARVQTNTDAEFQKMLDAADKETWKKFCPKLRALGLIMEASPCP